MNLFLPAPYQDELASSVCMRYIASFGRQEARLRFPAFFGKRERGGFHLPFHLPIALSRVALDYELHSSVTWIQLFLHHTIIPYLCAYQRPDAAALIYTTLLQGGDWRGKVYSVIRSAKHLVAGTLRWCPDCADEERESGEAWWHLSHQLAGVWTCDIHQVELIGADAVEGYEDALLWESAEILIPRDTAKYRKTPVLSDRLKMLSRHVIELLRQPTCSCSDEVPSLLIATQKAGFSGRVEERLCETTFETYWQEAISRLKGLDDFFPCGWLSHESCRDKVMRDPLCRTMWRIFLKDKYDVELEDEREREASNDEAARKRLILLCPNPFASHMGPIAMAIVSPRRWAGEFVRASCACGLSIKISSRFNRTIFDMSQVEAVNTYGKDWAFEVTSQVDAGMTLNVVAEAMKIPLGSAKVLYAKGRRTPSNWKQVVSGSKSHWKKSAFYCPNDSADHGPNHRVEQVRIPRRSEVAHLACSCGLRIVVGLECAGRTIHDSDIYRVMRGELRRTHADLDPDAS
ncbi:hypothetical protein LMG31506_05065 [Cupriavidus yeoncheonensis]|uniref:TniQ domain-containing protein n=1 Tax=Cupriavidus yeoncheonensis TaxID=1462994 RepID=A0A916MZV9_9BURK|nr:TniQ family protein [Cupriavidus yeoncheonensis]CAG2154397.1 hypothetical protein LMG31506_05065 [Cupriavidus yeoncheonensis]